LGQKSAGDPTRHFKNSRVEVVARKRKEAYNTCCSQAVTHPLKYHALRQVSSQLIKMYPHKALHLIQHLIALFQHLNNTYRPKV
jgi:hypothetical protein